LIYMVGFIFHADVPIYLTMNFIFTAPLIVAQSLCFMSIFFIFARLIKLNFSFSAFGIFLINILFSILYNASLTIMNIIERHLHPARVAEHELLVGLLILPSLIFILVVIFFIWLQRKLVRPSSPITDK
jgi:hypothetical protein